MSTATADLLSTSEAARILGVSAESVRRWAQAKKLPYTETPLGMVFDTQHVHDLAARRDQAARERPRVRQVGSRG